MVVHIVTAIDCDAHGIFHLLEKERTRIDLLFPSCKPYPDYGIDEVTFKPPFNVMKSILMYNFLIRIPVRHSYCRAVVIGHELIQSPDVCHHQPKRHSSLL